MTFAWYGHLKYKNLPLHIVIFTSWMIALVEYIFQVPANRIGSSALSPAQLKTIQEVISLSVFVIFSYYYLDQPITKSHILGFGLIAMGALVIFHKPI
jgi:uncharacterized protein (DUF486 family)